MSGGFAGGLAQGIGQGVQLYNQMGLMDLYKQNAARDAELHQAKMDEVNYQKDERDRMRAANQKVADLLTQKQQPQPVQNGQPGTLVNSPVSDTRAPGLSDVTQPAPQMPAGQVIAKSMLTGNLLSDPEKMTAIANIYAEHGLTDKMVPWMNQAYQAKKSGIVDALPYLMAGDGENAAAMLKKGGMDIQGTPTLVDKKNGVWSFNIGGQQREINAHDIALMANPEKAIEFQQKQPLVNAQIDSYNANAEKDRAMGAYYRGAKSNESMARADRYGRMGQGGVSSDKPEKIDAAIKRRDSTLDALSSVTGDDGKPFVDPQKRLQYSSLAVDAEQAITDSLGRDLTAKEHHKLTDLLRTAPLGNAQGMAQWGAQLQGAFGIGRPAKTGTPDTSSPSPRPNPANVAPAQPAAQPNPAALGGQTPLPAPSRLGGLAALQEQQQLRDQMIGVQRALQNPNLTAQQKLALALQANEIQQRTDAYYKGR